MLAGRGAGTPSSVARCSVHGVLRHHFAPAQNCIRERFFSGSSSAARPSGPSQSRHTERSGTPIGNIFADGAAWQSGGVGPKSGPTSITEDLARHAQSARWSSVDAPGELGGSEASSSSAPESATYGIGSILSRAGSYGIAEEEFPDESHPAAQRPGERQDGPDPTEAGPGPQQTSTTVPARARVGKSIDSGSSRFAQIQRLVRTQLREWHYQRNAGTKYQVWQPPGVVFAKLKKYHWDVGPTQVPALEDWWFRATTGNHRHDDARGSGKKKLSDEPVFVSIGCGPWCVARAAESPNENWVHMEDDETALFTTLLRAFDAYGLMGGIGHVGSNSVNSAWRRRGSLVGGQFVSNSRSSEGVGATPDGVNSASFDAETGVNSAGAALSEEDSDRVHASAELIEGEDTFENFRVIHAHPWLVHRFVPRGTVKRAYVHFAGLEKLRDLMKPLLHVLEVGKGELVLVTEREAEMRDVVALLLGFGELLECVNKRGKSLGSFGERFSASGSADASRFSASGTVDAEESWGNGTVPERGPWASAKRRQSAMAEDLSARAGELHEKDKITSVERELLRKYFDRVPAERALRPRTLRERKAEAQLPLHAQLRIKYNADDAAAAGPLREGAAAGAGEAGALVCSGEEADAVESVELDTTGGKPTGKWDIPSGTFYYRTIWRRKMSAKPNARFQKPTDANIAVGKRRRAEKVV
eukprot:gene277-35_t